MMKRLLSLLLTMVMVLSMVPVQAFAQAVMDNYTEPVPERETAEVVTVPEEPAVPMEAETEAVEEITEPIEMVKEPDEKNFESMEEMAKTPDEELEFHTELAYTDENSFNYNLYNDNGETFASITKYNGSDVNVSIPTTINGYPVKKVGQRAFTDNIKIISVVIPEGVTEIEDYAGYGCFSNCDKLTSISLPQSLTKIGSHAFNNCESLSEIKLPDNLISIGKCAFQGCSNLTELIFPETLKTVGDSAMYGTSIARLELPDSITSIDLDGLHGYLKYIRWTAGIPIIPQNQFYNFKVLETVILPEGVTEIEDYAGDGCFNNCVKLTSISLPQSLTKIGSHAFHHCKSLVEIKLPDNLRSIGDYAFSGCISLTGLELPNGLESVGFSALSETKVRKLELPDSIKSINLDGLHKQLTYIRWTAGIPVISQNEFYNFTALETVILPEGVTEIEDYKGNGCFNSCIKLTSVTLPQSLTKIGSHAFHHCESLTNVYYAGSGELWNAILIGDYNDELSAATIHYNSSGIESETSSSGFVQFFDHWDAAAQQAHFGSGFLETVLDVNEATDTSFVENIDDYVGKYVLVEADIPEDQLFTGTLISMKAVNSAIGTVSAVTLKDDGITMASITVDGTTYPCAESASPLLMELPVKVRYHIFEGTVVETRVLTQETGTFEAWDEQLQQATISGNVLSTNYMTDLSFLELGEDLVDMQVVYDTDGATLFSLTGIPKTYQLKVYSEEPSMVTSMNTSFDICVALCMYDTPVDEWEKPAMVVGNADVISVTDAEVEGGLYSFTIKGLAQGTSSLTITDAETGAYVSFSVGVGPALTDTAVFRMDEIPRFYPTWDKYSSHIETNFYNLNRMVINSFSDPIKLNGGHNVSFKVYNLEDHYGAVDVYDEHDCWIKSYKINKYTSLPESAVEAFEKLFYYFPSDRFAYDSKIHSAETTLTVFVPDGGYFVISNNYAKSPGTNLYNSVEILVETALTAVDVISAGLSIDKTAESIIDIIFADDNMKDAFIDVFFERSVDIVSNLEQDALVSSMGNIASASTVTTENILGAIGLDDWKSIVVNSLGLREDIFWELTGPVGKVADIGFKMLEAANRKCMILAIATSTKANSIKILAPIDKDNVTLSGVTVTPSTPEAIPEDAVLNAFRVAKQENESIVTSKGTQYTEYETYNICFVKDDKEVSINGKVTVSIPIPQGYNGEKCIILRKETDGNWTQLPSKTEGNFLIFETDHFSLYVIAEETEVSYTYGQNVQIKLIEPWGIRANAKISTDAGVVDYNSLYDYGVYFIRKNALDRAGLTQDTITVADIVNDLDAKKQTKANGVTVSSGYLSAIYDSDIYTYELDDSVFVMFYFVTEEGQYPIYLPVRERNLKTLAQQRMSDAVNFPNQLEREVYQKMTKLETDVADYRSDFANLSAPEKQKAPTLAQYPLGAAAANSSYSYGQNAQIKLIEPWGLKANVKVSLNGRVIDYSTVEEYGMVVLADNSRAYTDAAEILKNENAYVFSSKNGDASISGQYISATYSKDIYTYQLNTNIYVFGYVKDSDGYHYGPVRNRNVHTLMEARKNDVANFPNVKERTVYADMIDLYTAITAYREDYFNN